MAATSRRALRAALILGATAVLSVVNSSSTMASIRSARTHRHVHVEPIVKFALPSTATGCGGATALGGGAERIPIRVSTVAGQVAEVVNVCVGDQGPFPFLIDTGSGQSGIDASLAARLQLQDVGSPFKVEGIGCTGNAHFVQVPAWSVAGVPLVSQPLIASTESGIGGAGEPVGLLGSDVLSRFGAVRLDFKTQTLTVEGAEGPNPAAAGAAVHGPTGPLPSPVLTQGQTGTTVAATVDLNPGTVWLIVPIRFSNGPARNFVVDTGSTQTDVDTRVAAAAHLEHTDLAQRQQTVCSVVTIPMVHSGTWSVPGLILHPQLVDTQDFGPISAGGNVGTLGSDQLQRFGWVIFDYRGGRLILG